MLSKLGNIMEAMDERVIFPALFGFQALLLALTGETWVGERYPSPHATHIVLKSARARYFWAFMAACLFALALRNLMLRHSMFK